MTRELIWGGFMELLGFTVPLINYHALSRRIQNTFKFNRTVDEVEEEEILLTVTSQCAYCNERPVLPHHMGCGHVYCYYCLKGNLMADESFQCTICDRSYTKFEAILVK